MTKLLNHPGAFTVGYLLLRMVLAPLSPVPATVALDPLWVFALILYGKAGKGWMFSLIPGLVFGDWMCGMYAGQIAMRLAGFIALGLLPMQGGFNRVYISRVLSYALWSSLVPDWMGHFPLGYLYLVWILQAILWWGIAAPRKEEKGLAPLGPLFVVPVGLIFLHIFFPAPGLWPLPQLGSQSGLMIRILAGFLLIPPFVGWFLNKRVPKVPEKKGGRWTHLAE